MRTPTINQLIASNIRRIREIDRGLTRQQLAERMTAITGEEVKPHRIIDLEGARSKSREPATAGWGDLTALAIALEVKIYDLVLPPDDQSRVQLSTVSWSETVSLPEPIRNEITGKVTDRTTKTVFPGVTLTRDQAAKLWFGLGSDVLTGSVMDSVAQTKGYDDDLTRWIEQIARTQQRHSEILERIERRNGE